MFQGVYFAGSHRKRVLVTGGTGTIGRELVSYFKRQPDQDVVTLRSDSGQRIDLREKAKVQAFLQQQSFDSIYHLAALNPGQSNRGEDYFDTNVQGTENLLEGVLALKKQGKKVPDVFLASSALAYAPEKIALTGFQETTPLDERALSGTLAKAHQAVQKLHPADGKIADALLSALHLSKPEIYYNDSKLLAEMTAHEYAQKGVPVKVGRLVNCYSQQSSQLINQLVADAKAGKAPTLAGKDTEARDYLFCDGNSSKDDVLRLIRAVTEKGKVGEAYNISSGGRFVRTPQALAQLAQKSKSPVSDASSATGFRVALSNQKLVALAVEAPKTSPEQGVELLRSRNLWTRGIGVFKNIGQWFKDLFGKLKSWLGQLFGAAKSQNK